MTSADTKLSRIRKERLVVRTPDNHFVLLVSSACLFVFAGHFAASRNISRIGLNFLSKDYDYNGLLFFAGLCCIYLGVRAAAYGIMRIVNYGPELVLNEDGIELNSGYFYRCQVAWDGIVNVRIRTFSVPNLLFWRTRRYIEIALYNPRALIDPLTFWEQFYVQFPFPRKKFPIYIMDNSVDENLDWLAEQIRKRVDGGESDKEAKVI